MDKQITITIEKIVHIPSDFYRRNVSELTLVSESGYVELYDKINETEIVEVLKLYPHLVGEWLQWSEDKRSTPTWHFDKFDDGTYAVAYSSEGEFEEINTKDEFIACAAFIKREIETDRVIIMK